MMRWCYLQSTVGLVLFFFLFGIASGEDICRWGPSGQRVVTTHDPVMESSDRDVYTGMLRVYVTEISGRWDDNDNIPFHNAFLAFALETSISLGESDTLTWDLQWDGNDYTDAGGFSFGDLEEDDVKVFAAVFNSAGYPGYSDPPSGGQFTVHEVDACAAATSGTTGYNLAYGNFTHSILVEDGSTTW